MPIRIAPRTTAPTMRNVKKTIKYQDWLLKSLKEPLSASHYLNAALEENDPEAFLVALRNVVDAFGMSKLARETDLDRVNLYRVLSKYGNPRLTSLTKLLTGLGLKLYVKEKQRKAA